MSTPRLFALLVGVDEYKSPRISDLNGCVNDAKAMHSFLTQTVGVPPQNIRLLTSTGDESPQDRASRDGIVNGWMWLIEQASAGDQLFFHYSGHGAQAKSTDPNEPDGYDETLVPFDSRENDENGNPVYDILDKELATLIELAEAKGALVTVFLDCCHSGSGTRALVPVRKTENDERTRPPGTLVPGTKLRAPAATRSTQTRSGWKLSGPGDGGHVLLAGCRDEQLSHEYRSPINGDWHGATTFFLLQKLRDLRPDLTWREVHDVVQTKVHAVYERQMPQLEGPGNRTIFGGLVAAPGAYLRVTDAEADGDGVLVRIDGGAAVGLTPGSRVELHPAGSSSLQERALGSGEVVDAKVDYAYALIEGVQPSDFSLPARAKITAYGYENLAYDVATDDPLMVAALSAEDASPFLQVVEADSRSAQFFVSVADGHYRIQDGSGVQIVWEMPPHSEAGAAKTAENLHHLAVFQNVRKLRNPSPMPLLDGALSVEAQSYTRAGFSGPKDGEPLGDDGVLPPGRKLWLTVRNNSADDLYVTVLNLSAHFGVYRIYPERAPNQRVAPGKDFFISGIEPEVDDPYAESTTEILKVFATRDPMSFDVLEMSDLNEPDETGKTRASGPLAELMNGIRHDGAGTRKLVVRRDDTHDRWITKQVEITVLKAQDVRALPEGSTSVEVGSAAEISLEKPAGLSGQLVVSNLTNATRDVDDPLALPPGLDNPDAAEFFEPVSFSDSTRSVGASPGVLAIRAEAGQLAAVSDESPLRVELSVADEPDVTGILPVAFDGEYYYVAGQPTQAQTASRDVGKRRLAVEITHLPQPADAGDAGDGDGDGIEGEPPSRDLKRTARLFFYKIRHKERPRELGVRKASTDADGMPVYEPVSPADVAAAEKPLLIVHGFTSSTEWFVQKALADLLALDGYDLALTYDYETLNTGIRENGRLLAEELRGLGFGADGAPGLDIFCHSMGTQVTRACVELEGGHEFVDRVFMGGALNAGTKLAEAQRFGSWLVTILLNQAGLAPPEFLARLLSRGLSDVTAGLRDLAPSAELYSLLNRPETGQDVDYDVDYYVQIGNNAAADGPIDWRRIFSKSELMRLFDRGLDELLGPNDLLVGVASAQSLRGGNWPDLQVDVLGCNHLQYFYTEESLDALRQQFG